MDDARPPLIPPSHRVHAKPLPKWRWLPQFFINPLSVYSENSFEITFGRARALGVDTVAVSDPEGIQHVLKTNMQNYKRPVIQARLFRPVMGYGLFLAESETWRRQRRMLAPVFNPSAISDLIPHFRSAGEKAVERLQGLERTQLTEVFHRGALDAVLKALFSLPADEGRAGMTTLARNYLDGAGRPTVLDAIATGEDHFGFATGARRRFKRDWTRMVDEVIADRKRGGSDQPHKRGDLLDLLLSARDPQTGEAIDDVEIRDQCATLLAAGFETTSRLLFWASYLLGLDRAEQARVREEIRAFPVDRINTMADMAHWPRLRNVLLEALRLYPPVAYVVRKAIHDDVIMGNPITAGTEVWISPWIIHRHKKYWDRPTAFMPDRFSGIPSPWTSMDTYLPFGGGPRICIGAGFAIVEAQIILASLLSNFRLVPEDNKPVLPMFRLATVPDRDPWFKLEKAHTP